MKNLWKKLAQREVYKNAWIEVEEHDVISPRGKKGIYGKVKFKNKAIGIIALDESKHTWLVGQHRYTLDAYSWEIPMGGGALAIDPLETAKRELKEETGLTAKKWTLLMHLHTSNSVTDEEGFVFLAEDLTEGVTDFDDTEDLQIKKLPFQEVVRMVMDGEITDAISVAGILKLDKMLGEIELSNKH
ncbi:NUDIX domain-containing protein [Penaeicola halotolerans]|uniref:NUDIX domain-containing protein n=1 Tax=Penaeicola halotolerans TaxID=2793196 RepID=UPI001CF90F0C|nr:NUDIX hydrolase [Penaeicola halotolerans]